MERLVGVNPVLEAIRAGRRIRRLWIVEHSRNPRLTQAVQMASERGIPVERTSRSRLDRLAGGRAHQGVIADVEARPEPSWTDTVARLADRTDAIVLLLDHLQDPQNLGAIIRTAEGAGVDAVFIPKRGAATVTATVAKVAAGATEYLPIVRVANIAQVVGRLQEAGFWVVGAESDRDAGTLSYDEFDYNGRIALVIGHEGKGLSRLVRERCDALVHIPMYGQVESLNASVATGILLYEIRRQRKGKERTADGG